MNLITSFFGWILSLIFDLVSNFTSVGTLGITIIVFTFVTRLLMTPLQISQQKSLRIRTKIQPELEKIRIKYKDKKDQESQARMLQETQALHKKYKIKPTAGCLTMLIQLPLIFSLFNVLREPIRYIDKLKVLYTDMAQVIKKVPNYQEYLNVFMEQVKKSNHYDFDLTAMDIAGKVRSLPDFLSYLTSMQWKELIPKFSSDVQQALNANFTQKLNYEYFLGINLVDSPEMLVRNGVYWALLVPVIAGVSTYIFSKLNMSANAALQNGNSSSPEVNSTQETMKYVTMFMPLVTAWIAYSTSSGLALYWITGNIIMMGQQMIVNKIVDKQEAKIEELIRKENEQPKKTKKVVKKKVIKKVPVSELKGNTKK